MSATLPTLLIKLLKNALRIHKDVSSGFRISFFPFSRGNGDFGWRNTIAIYTIILPMVSNSLAAGKYSN